MTLTVNIAPEADARLRHLVDLEGEEERDFEEAVEAIRKGLADLEAGDRGMLLEDYRTQLQIERLSSTRNAA